MRFTLEWARRNTFPNPGAEILAELKQRLKHILINRIPLYDGPPYVTLDDVGPVVAAYQIFNLEAFINSVCSVGYELADSWLTSELACIVRWHPENSFASHSGLYFRAK